MFSVVVACHNRPALLRRALASVIAQTETDWELLVVDDGSTEDVGAVVASFDDPRLRCVRTVNMGAAVARNVGIALTSGPWVAFLDSDDWWLPEKLAACHASLAGGARAVYSGFAAFHEPEDLIEVVDEPRRGDIERALHTGNPIRAFSSVVVERTVLETVGGFDISFPARQDVDLFLRIARHTPFVAVPGVLCMVSRGAADRISARPTTRLRGFERFLDKHGSSLTRRERSHLHKRALWFAWRARDGRAVARHAPAAVLDLVASRGRQDPS